MKEVAEKAEMLFNKIDKHVDEVNKAKDQNPDQLVLDKLLKENHKLKRKLSDLDDIVAVEDFLENGPGRTRDVEL